MAYLTYMLVNNRAVSCIEKAKTLEYPNGLAHLLLKRLDQKFMPKGGFKMSRLRDKLRKLKFKDKDDPNNFFEKIAGIKNLSMPLDQTDSISKDELVSHVISATPEKLMTCIKKVIDLQKENITVDHLEEEILEWYDLRNNKLDDSDDSDASTDEYETAMTGFTFNGKCYNCGKEGHLANTCKERKNDRANNQQGRGAQGRDRFTGKCCKCDKVSHTKDPDCWEHEKNASKRLKGYKTAASHETGMAAADDAVSKSTLSKKSIAICDAHCKYGHMNETDCRQTAKALGYRVLCGVLKACAACAVAKAQQKSVPKPSASKKSTEPNGHIFLDLSKIKAPKDLNITVARNNWHLVVCEYTGLKYSAFFEMKDGMVEPTCSKMNQWKQQGKPVTIVRMDNAGENLKLAKAANGKDWKVNLEFEYTGKTTPQRNHLVTLWARARTTMIEAKVPLAIRYLVCKECIALQRVHRDCYPPRWTGYNIIKWSVEDQIRTMVQKTPKVYQVAKDLG